MSTQITLSTYQLASLIGSLANPNPDDDSEPHGPGAPVIRNVAQLRAVARMTVNWAIRFVDTAQAAHVGAANVREANVTKKTESASFAGIGAGLPDEAVRGVVAPRLMRFVDDYCGTGPIHLLFPIDWWNLLHPHPIPWPDPDPNPWTLTLENPRERRIGQLVTGAELQFAANAAGGGELGELFGVGARKLFERGTA